MDDKQLMAQIAAGDQAALQTLLRRHGPLLQYILKPILTDPREREECLADISLRLWQRAGDYAPERGQFVPWLTVLARNMAWVLKCLEAGKAAGVPLPEGEERIYTSFIR